MVIGPLGNNWPGMEGEVTFGTVDTHSGLVTWVGDTLCRPMGGHCTLDLAEREAVFAELWWG